MLYVISNIYNVTEFNIKKVFQNKKKTGDHSYPVNWEVMISFLPLGSFICQHLLCANTGLWKWVRRMFKYISCIYCLPNASRRGFLEMPIHTSNFDLHIISIFPYWSLLIYFIYFLVRLNIIQHRGTQINRSIALLIETTAGSNTFFSAKFFVMTWCCSNLDYIHLMTFDYHGFWENVTGMNSPLYAMPDEEDATRNVVSIHWENYLRYVYI